MSSPESNHSYENESQHPIDKYLEDFQLYLVGSTELPPELPVNYGDEASRLFISSVCENLKQKHKDMQTIEQLWDLPSAEESS